MSLDNTNIMAVDHADTTQKAIATIESRIQDKSKRATNCRIIGDSTTDYRAI